MPCACQNKKRFEVVTTVTDPKTQQPKEKIVFSSQHKTVADNVAKRYPGSTVREYDPAKKK
ncbi:hypothetical protein [Streptomyces afghaniensis]|uniref:hypothetical protein n=1 Tax=Streptomyces afghaniensis TaxID=66865 RepID=UPI002788BD7E|nr:hypothetical protein [Streptomyces afghaniensis]MDQ1018950.1 hypothetical protein [Streptomyces afghaniensis]